MGVRVIIGISERENDGIKSHWITDQINSIRRDGTPVCVKVILSDYNGVNLSIATSACSGLGGGGRTLNEAQQKVVDLWRKHHLSEADVTPGNLIAFLNQLGI